MMIRNPERQVLPRTFCPQCAETGKLVDKVTRKQGACERCDGTGIIKALDSGYSLTSAHATQGPGSPRGSPVFSEAVKGRPIFLAAPKGTAALYGKSARSKHVRCRPNVKLMWARTSSPACPRQWRAIRLVPDPISADDPSCLRRHQTGSGLVSSRLSFLRSW